MQTDPLSTPLTGGQPDLVKGELAVKRGFCNLWVDFVPAEHCITIDRCILCRQGFHVG